MYPFEHLPGYENRLQLGHGERQVVSAILPQHLNYLHEHNVQTGVARQQNHPFETSQE